MPSRFSPFRPPTFSIQMAVSPILLFLQRFWNPHRPSLGQPTIAIQCLQASWLVGVTSFCCPEFIISILCFPLPAHRPNGWPGDISPPFTHNGCKLNSFPLIVFLIVLTSWARAAGLWRCHCFIRPPVPSPDPNSFSPYRLSNCLGQLSLRRVVRGSRRCHSLLILTQHLPSLFLAQAPPLRKRFPYVLHLSSPPVVQPFFPHGPSLFPFLPLTAPLPSLFPSAVASNRSPHPFFPSGSPQ